jgi:ATP-binding cassette subfamily E protein 1
VIKPQYVDNIPRRVQGTVGELLGKNDSRGVMAAMLKDMDLEHVVDRKIDVLSGGALAADACALTPTTTPQASCSASPSRPRP